MGGEITIEYRSPHLAEAVGGTLVVVTLPTFRRPDHLAATLRSLEGQETRHRFAVIVMENDAEGRAGLAAARPFLSEGRLDGLVVVAHERGNCSAYNAGWQTAMSQFPALSYLLVIDDDECAAPDWIERMVATSAALRTDFVGAPQRPIFEDERAQGLKRHPVFMAHYCQTGRVPILYSSGNVLISRRVLEAMGPPYLDTAFNFVGGGDSDFYDRAKARGFTFGWCEEGAVFETQPRRRTEFSWIHARSLRNGALSLIIEKRRHRGAADRLRSLAKSLALLAASPLRGLHLGWRTGSAMIGLYHLQVAIGRLQGEIGWIDEQYRHPERN